MLRVAAPNGADFEWDVHYPAHLQAGGTDEKCAALRNTDDSVGDLVNERERAVIALTDQSTKHVDVDGAVVEELTSLFGETQTVEAVATVVAYNMVSRFLVALAI